MPTAQGTSLNRQLSDGNPDGSTIGNSVTDTTTVNGNFVINNRFFFSTNQIVATGTNLATAAALTVDTAYATSTGSNQGIVLPAALPGADITIFNASANNILVYPPSGTTINGTSTALTLPPGVIMQSVGVAAGTYISAVGNLPAIYTYNTNTATSGTTLTTANITGAYGFVEITLGMTGTLGGAANAQLPLVATLQAAVPNPFTGQTWKLRIINASSANFAWTVTTNTGWTLTGTMSIAQNTWRDFYITFTSATAATLQSVGTGTNS